MINLYLLTINMHLYISMQVKNLHVHQSFFWGGCEIKVWRGLVEGLCVYFLEPQNGYVEAYFTLP